MRKLLCFVVFLHVLALAVAQTNAGLTLKIVNKPISVVLNEITKKAGYSFVIPTNDLNVNKYVTIDVKNQPIERVLDIVFKNMEVIYRIDGKNVYVSKRERKKEPTSHGRINVRGIVEDENGNPIIGATIMDKLTNTGTTTDLNGNFSIMVPDGNDLDISYLGYTSVKMKATDKKSLLVRLYEDTKKLDEVVVVGYGVQRKSDLTGAITSVKAEDLNNTPTTTMAEMLRGKAAGIQVSLSSAKPGARLIFIFVDAALCRAGMHRCILLMVFLWSRLMR